MTMKQKDSLIGTRDNLCIPERIAVIEDREDASWVLTEKSEVDQNDRRNCNDKTSICVALFIDPNLQNSKVETLQGIKGNGVTEFSWLKSYDDPILFREALSRTTSDQSAWIVSESTSDGLNLAAALKKDVPARQVCLCCVKGSGSLFSRCKNAGVEPVFGQDAFEQLVDDMRYANLMRLGFGALKNSEDNLLEAQHEMIEEISDEIDDALETHMLDKYSNEISQPLYDNYIIDDYVNQELLSAQNAMRQNALQHDGRQLDAMQQEELQAGVLSQNLDLQDSSSYSDEAWLTSFDEEVNNPYFDCDAYSPSANIDASFPINLPAPQPQSQLQTQTQQPQTQTQQPEQEMTYVSRNHKSFVMSVVSGSGGTGKSSIALLSAMLLQMRGKRVLLLDGDLQFGDLNSLIGQDSPITLLDLVEHPERIQSLEPIGVMPAYIAAPTKLEQSELLFATLPQTIEHLKDHFDAIVINTGCCWSDEHVGLFAVSNCTLFVMDQRPVSIRTCNHALEFCTRAGVPMQNFAYALNFSHKQSLITPMDVSCALQGALVYEIADGGNEVRELMSAGRSEELIASGNAFSESLKSLMLELVPGLEPAPIPISPKKRKRRFLKKSA